MTQAEIRAKVEPWKELLEFRHERRGELVPMPDALELIGNEDGILTLGDVRALNDQLDIPFPVE